MHAAETNKLKICMGIYVVWVDALISTVSSVVLVQCSETIL